MHVDHADYSYTDFYNDRQIIKQAAILFGTPIEKLIRDLHESEKQKLLRIIHDEVIDPAIASPELDEKIKASVKNTAERLSKKTSAREIVVFFNNALLANKEYGFEVEEKHEYEICRFSTKVMKLCPKKYQPLSQYLLNNARFKNLSAMINAGTQITASFRALHNQGDSYQDLKLPIKTLSNCSTAFFPILCY